MAFIITYILEVKMSNLRTKEDYWPTSEPTAEPSIPHEEPHHELLSHAEIAGLLLLSMIGVSCIMSRYLPTHNPGDYQSMDIGFAS